jgi:hypothetical protein
MTLKSWSDTESIHQLSEEDDTVKDQWVFGLFSSSCILNNTAFWKLDLFPSSGEGVGDTYSVGSIKKS